MHIEGSGAAASVGDISAAAQSTETQAFDLDAVAPLRTETRTTPDGKTVVVEYLHEDGDLTVARETTLNARGGVTEQQMAFDTGAGNDAITIDGNTNGVATISVNGQAFTTSVPPAATNDFAPYTGITVRSGAGNDVIEVAKGSDINLTADGGAGDDRIVGGEGLDRLNGSLGDDTLVGNGGRDDLFGASGNDSLSGGDGNDILYGGDGDDFLSGSNGNDYLEGGRGDDRAFGGAGSDILSGGIGADRLYGGSGDDAVYTGQGADYVNNLMGNDKVYGQTAEDDINTASQFLPATNSVVNVELNAEIGASSVIIEGSPEFVQRVEADIEFLRSSPIGQGALGGVDQAFADDGHTVTIRELSGEKNGFASSPSGIFGELDVNGNPGATASAQINYNPSFSTDAFDAPVIVLAHEFAHAYNIVTGTLQPGVHSSTGPSSVDNGIRNAERQAVGLENSGVPYDGDNDPSTPDSTINPVELTENGLRAEAGLALRPSYVLP
ncbi:MAG: M91 family zinc metallopeptidase [Gammaproteobacteria bacterium]